MQNAKGLHGRSVLSGLVFMVFGSALVIGTLLMINRLAEAPSREAEQASTSFAVERAPEPPPQRVVRREPPPPQRSRAEAPPMVSLDSSLSGIDFGIPGLDAGDLGSLQDQLLGDTADVVMTDDSVDAPPRPVYQAPLDYPRTARAQGVQGYVVLSLLISAAGEIERVQVLEAEPAGIFEESAIQGVQAWRFEPAQYQGRSVKVWARQRIRFDLS
ncbi:energy transducer TonB [Wenzhouxiangella marina]|uniref:Protein TonB n=1 Tax=Wenzhouxiangella marina TaxID=1579979 RepID=A0A0K0XX16_9GAMM|nr:energy transducer TonB [Wenzhouxiangella marina]AKS42229.1 TonB family protein [Wenzhouxiangella marina]MBB6085999.1 protein TonB [Wenzhouxiangella marina]